MYAVNNEKFDSFFSAIATAKAVAAQVIEVDTGKVRWSPAPAISQKKRRMYEERKAAYAVQQKAKA